jgi:hypothetical protein
LLSTPASSAIATFPGTASCSPTLASPAIATFPGTASCSPTLASPSIATFPGTASWSLIPTSPENTAYSGSDSRHRHSKLRYRAAEVRTSTLLAITRLEVVWANGILKVHGTLQKAELVLSN